MNEPAPLARWLALARERKVWFVAGGAGALAVGRWALVGERAFEPQRLAAVLPR